MTIIAPELCTGNSLRVAWSTAKGTKAKRTPQRAKVKRPPFILTFVPVDSMMAEGVEKGEGE